MKKFIILTGSLLVTATAFVFAFNASVDAKNDLILSNIEALAASEWYGQTCYNSITTAKNQTVLYCSTCGTGPTKDSKPAVTSGTSTCSE